MGEEEGKPENRNVKLENFFYFFYIQKDQSSFCCLWGGREILLTTPPFENRRVTSRRLEISPEEFRRRSKRVPSILKKNVNLRSHSIPMVLHSLFFDFNLLAITITADKVVWRESSLVIANRSENLLASALTFVVVNPLLIEKRESNHMRIMII